MFWSDKEIHQVRWDDPYIVKHLHLKPIQVTVCESKMVHDPTPDFFCETVLLSLYGYPNVVAGLSPCGRAFFFAVRPH